MQDRSPLSPEASGGSPSPRDSLGPGLAIFERIGFFNRFAAAWYLARGYRVRYLDLAAPVPGWSRPSQERAGRLERIRWGNLDLHHQFALNNEVLRGIDEAFRRELGSSRLISLLGDLVGTDRARDAYLKYLALERYDHALKAYQITETGVREGGGRDPVVVLSDPLLPDAIPRAGEAGGKGVRIPLWNRFFLSLRQLGEKAGYLGILALLPLYLLAKVGIPSPGAPAPRALRLGIRVYRTDFGSHRRYRSVDFLVDGKDLHAGNTLICVETPLVPLTREALGKKGYRIAEIDRSLRGVPPGFLRGCILGRGIPFWVRALPLALGESPSTIRQTLEFFLTYLLWEAFFTRYRLAHYVTYNDTLPKDIIRNLVLARHGVQTWYYEHSSNTSNLFVPEGQEEHAAVLYAFLNYDHLVAWGDKVRRFYELHPQRIGAYENLGCPWSEHVAMARADPGENRCLDLARRHFSATLGAVPPRLISIFDTSPNESSFVSRKKLAGFLEGILRMMEEDPSSGYLFKMKTPREEIARDFPDLAPLYERIRLSPRCLLLDALSSEVSEAIAISDIVVSACFTSPTIEALGARQKAIYYDADGSFRGCYYDRFPRLVAHGYGELREILEYWLTAPTREDLDRFLDTQVRGELDAFVDGKGITRFRALLLA